jgi:hypothetical protein
MADIGTKGGLLFQVFRIICSCLRHQHSQEEVLHVVGNEFSWPPGCRPMYITGAMFARAA